MASDCIQKWISAKMITTDRDRKLKVGKAIKNDRQNILCYLSTPACTCTINCLHAWPPESNSMIYKQYIHGELCWICLELYWQVASNNMLEQWKALLKHFWSCLLLKSFISMALEKIFLMLPWQGNLLGLWYQMVLALNISLCNIW